jgi:hypothetical protein
VFQQIRVMENLHWRQKPARFSASGGITFCRVSTCARLTQRSGLFFYYGCGGSSRIVDFSCFHASTPGLQMSIRTDQTWGTVPGQTLSLSVTVNLFMLLMMKSPHSLMMSMRKKLSPYLLMLNRMPTWLQTIGLSCRSKHHAIAYLTSMSSPHGGKSYFSCCRSWV